MAEQYKIVDAKGKHLFNKKVFNSFIETYNFIDALEVEDLENISGMELFAVPTTYFKSIERGWQNDRNCVYYNFSSFIGGLRLTSIIMVIRGYWKG